MIGGINKRSVSVVFSCLTFSPPDILKPPLPTQTHHGDNLINREGGGKICCLLLGGIVISSTVTVQTLSCHNTLPRRGGGGIHPNVISSHTLGADPSRSNGSDSNETDLWEGELRKVCSPGEGYCGWSQRRDGMTGEGKVQTWQVRRNVSRLLHQFIATKTISEGSWWLQYIFTTSSWSIALVWQSDLLFLILQVQLSRRMSLLPVIQVWFFLTHFKKWQIQNEQIHIVPYFYYCVNAYRDPPATFCTFFDT